MEVVEEDFFPSPRGSQRANETPLEQPSSPERQDSLCESVSSIDSSDWRHPRSYYEAHDGRRCMEFESFRSCSSFASSAYSVNDTDLQFHNLSMRSEELRELRDEMKRKLSLERSKHLVSNWTIQKLNLWLLKMDALPATQAVTNRGLIPGLGRWRQKRRLRLKQLDLQREADDLTDAITRMPLLPLRLISPPPTKLMGQQTILSLIRNLLVNNNEVHIVGVYGAEGVGKTRIVEELHDHLAKEGESARFDIVIWLTFSNDSWSVRKIQDRIAQQLGSYFDDESEDKPLEWNHRATILRNTLSSMRFLLILDGVRELDLELDLEDVGIPLPDKNNWCKIVITSRSKEVCENMGVAAPGLLEVSPLTEEESWELFCDIVGGADNDESWKDNSEMNLIASQLVQTLYPWPHKLCEMAEALSKVKKTSRSWRVFRKNNLPYYIPNQLIPGGQGTYYLSEEMFLDIKTHELSRSKFQ